MKEILASFEGGTLTPEDRRVLANLIEAQALLEEVAEILDGDTLNPEVAKAASEVLSARGGKVFKSKGTVERLYLTDATTQIIERRPDIKEFIARRILDYVGPHEIEKEVQEKFGSELEGGSPAVYIRFFTTRTDETNRFVIENILNKNPDFARIMGSPEIRKYIRELFFKEAPSAGRRTRKIFQGRVSHPYELGNEFFTKKMAPAVDSQFGVNSIDTLRYIFLRGPNAIDFFSEEHK